MSWLDEISNFLEDYSAVYDEDPHIDIYKDMHVIGDDFHEMIEDYSKQYKVDMSDYLWYFHAEEEGYNVGGMFFKPPYKRVTRIPVTPQMLADFIMTKKWKVEYPDHEIPKRRIDLLINQILVIAGVIGLGIWIMFNVIS